MIFFVIVTVAYTFLFVSLVQSQWSSTHTFKDTLNVLPTNVISLFLSFECDRKSMFSLLTSEHL